MATLDSCESFERRVYEIISGPVYLELQKGDIFRYNENEPRCEYMERETDEMEYYLQVKAIDTFTITKEQAMESII